MAAGSDGKQVSLEAEARLAALEKRILQLEQGQKRESDRLTATILSPDTQRLHHLAEDVRTKPLTAILSMLGVMAVALLIATLLAYVTFQSFVD